MNEPVSDTVRVRLISQGYCVALPRCDADAPYLAQRIPTDAKTVHEAVRL